MREPPTAMTWTNLRPLLIGGLLILLAIAVVLPGWVYTPLEGLKPTPLVEEGYCPYLADSRNCQVSVEPAWWPIASTAWISVRYSCRGEGGGIEVSRLERRRTLTGWEPAEDAEMKFQIIDIVCD
jgi:hypothetical protein